MQTKIIFFSVLLMGTVVPKCNARTMEELLRAGEKMKVKKGIVSLPVSMISIED